MERTKKIGKIVTLTVLTILVLFYILPNVTLIEQSLEIKATPDKVFEMINRPDKWVEWYVPLQDKSGARIRYSGPEQGEGASLKWVTGNPKAPGGSMNIRSSKNNRNVSAVVNLTEKHSAIMTFRIKPVRKDASLLTITSRLQFPQDSLLHYFRMMFDRSEELAVIDYLENIDQAVIEKAEGISVHLQKMESFPYIGILDSCKWENVPLHMKNTYNELLIYIAKSGLIKKGYPVAIYHHLSEKQVVYELGIPINDSTSSTGRIQYKVMPAGNNVVADYYGSYDTLEDGHNAIQRWMQRYGRRLSGYPWEMYVTDPAAEPDPNKWLTRIFYPVD